MTDEPIPGTENLEPHDPVGPKGPKPIAQAWFEYQAATIPPGAGPEQRKLMRRAFYAGYAAAAARLVPSLLDRQADSHARVENLRAMDQELKLFSAAVRGGEA